MLESEELFCSYLPKIVVLSILPPSHVVEGARSGRHDVVYT